MTPPPQQQLSRRERQIMDILYRLGEAGASEVVEHLPDRPAYNSVRVTLGILERKGMARHRQQGTRYIYAPTVPAAQASESAMRHLVRTFFRGSPSKAILTLLDSPSTRLSPADLEELAARVEAARREHHS
jgi:BlaI family transcriptional regulator, penicillinase repressor